jgi:hypothetical protein
MRSEKIKTPPTKPATPISKRSDQVKASVSTDDDGQGIATIEQWDSQRALQIPELPDADVELIEDDTKPGAEGSDRLEEKSAPTADV